jgi:hypothetical protein
VAFCSAIGFVVPGAAGALVVAVTVVLAIGFGVPGVDVAVLAVGFVVATADGTVALGERLDVATDCFGGNTLDTALRTTALTVPTTFA